MTKLEEMKAAYLAALDDVFYAAYDAARDAYAAGVRAVDATYDDARADARAAVDATYDAARTDARAAVDATYDAARADAWNDYRAELKKIQEENSND
jgi:hypothetical protein